MSRPNRVVNQRGRPRKVPPSGAADSSPAVAVVVGAAMGPPPGRAGRERGQCVRGGCQRPIGDGSRTCEPSPTGSGGSGAGQPRSAGGFQTYGVVVVTGSSPSRARIGRLSSDASTW